MTTKTQLLPTRYFVNYQHIKVNKLTIKTLINIKKYFFLKH
jgi:hypothetical protein